MHLFDPDRPQLNSQPLFLVAGKGRGVVPAPSIHFLPSGGAEVGVFLPSSDKGWARRTCEVHSVAELTELLADWCMDPEKTAVVRFNWNPPGPAGTAASGIITLESLGLVKA